MKLRTILLATAAFATFANASASYAENIETVVVTAEKRSEDVQNVPISLTVIGADRLANANVSSFADITKFAPSVTMTAGDQPANNAIVIRGIGTFAFSIAVEPSVLAVVDDVAAGYQAQAFTDLVDIDRVEVLNGPQSTLYGKSASAGLVAVTTKAPTDTFTYFGDVRITNDGEQRFSASVSGPISDTVAFRLSGSVREYGGNVFNLATHTKIDDDHSASVRGKIQWKPNENFDATFTAHFSQDNSKCCAQPLTRLDPGAVLFGQAALTPAVAIPGITPGPNNRTVILDTDPVANAQDYGLSSHISYDFGELTFYSITALNRYALHDLTDNDTTAADPLFFYTPFVNAQPAGSSPPTVAAQTHGGIDQGGRFNVRTLTQEFRLVSNGEHDFNYLVGVYYSNEDLIRAFGRGGVAGTSSAPAGGLGQVVTNVPESMGPPFLGNGRAIANWRGETRYENYALFGQATWKVFTDTTLIAGLRFNREDSTYTYDDYYRVIHFPLITAPKNDVSDVITGKVGLQYQVTDDIMAFGTVSKGYKGVAYDLVTGLSALEASTFPVEAETSFDYEVGVRSAWFDRRLVLNATLYDTEYKNFQIQTIIPDIPNTFILANIPKARTRGLELEANAQITDDLSFNGGYAYTDAVAVNYPLGQCYAGQQLPTTCTTTFLPPPNNTAHGQDLSGARLPNAPLNKFSIGADYKIGLGDLPFYAKVNASFVWQSTINFGITHDPGTVQKGYGLMNLNVSLIESEHSRYTVAFFVNNLFDQHYASNRSNVRGNWFGGSAPTEAYAQEIPRDYNRYVGFRLAVSSE
ncbi:MAG: TonB-dependent receptor [Rhizomicrobium sp.]